MGGYVEGVPLEDQCWFHGIEPVPPSYYVICVECGHCYVTEAELVELDAKVRADCAQGEPVPVLTGAEIHSCPLCTHDF